MIYRKRPLEKCGWKKKNIYNGERFMTCGYEVIIRSNLTFIGNTDNSKYSKHINSLSLEELLAIYNTAKQIKDENERKKSKLVAAL